MAANRWMSRVPLKVPTPSGSMNVPLTGMAVTRPAAVSELCPAAPIGPMTNIPSNTAATNAAMRGFISLSSNRARVTR